MRHTQEQLSIFSAMRQSSSSSDHTNNPHDATGSSNNSVSLKILAGPGTGKTTTVRYGAGSLQRPVFMAFNAAMVAQMANLQAVTVFAAAKRCFAPVDVNAVVDVQFLREVRGMAAVDQAAHAFVETHLLPPPKNKSRKTGPALNFLFVAFASLLKAWNHSDATSFAAWKQNTPKLYLSPPNERRLLMYFGENKLEALRTKCIELLELLWHDVSEKAGRVRNYRLSFDTYTKVAHVRIADGTMAVCADLRNASHLIVDEAQDLTPCQVGFLSAIAKRQSIPLILVGDPAQGIYCFRGARPYVFRGMRATENLQLSTSFRFGKNIAEVANTILYATNQQRGHGNNNNTRFLIKGAAVDEGLVSSEDWERSAPPEQSNSSSSNNYFAVGTVTFIARKNITCFDHALKVFRKSTIVRENEENSQTPVASPCSSTIRIGVIMPGFHVKVKQIKEFVALRRHVDSSLTPPNTPLASQHSVSSAALGGSERSLSSSSALPPIQSLLELWPWAQNHSWEELVRTAQHLLHLDAANQDGGDETAADLGLASDEIMSSNDADTLLYINTFTTNTELDHLLDALGKVVEVRKDSMQQFNGDILCMTTHQAKGQEWDNVHVADDYCPIEEADDMHISLKIFKPVRMEEAACLYVAATRAKRRLRVPEWLMTLYTEHGEAANAPPPDEEHGQQRQGEAAAPRIRCTGVKREREE